MGARWKKPASAIWGRDEGSADQIVRVGLDSGYRCGNTRWSSSIRPPAVCVSPADMTVAEPEFAALAIEQFDALYGLARRLSGSASQAEDLVQETYLRALRARESFQLEQFGIRPWLMRILHNLHVNQGIRESRQPVAMEEEALEQVPGGAMDAGRGLSYEQLDQELVRAIQNLAEAYRSVLLLWAVEELNYAEIAERLNLPVGTVMSRLHRARKKISMRLESYGNGRWGA